MDDVCRLGGEVMATRKQKAPVEQAWEPIPAEPWGRRLARCRREISGLTLKEAADIISQVSFTSQSALSRLEELRDPPTNRHQHNVAYLCCLLYRVNPEEMGVSDAYLPGVIRLALAEGAIHFRP